MSYRKEKLPETLKQLAAEFIERESGKASLITVTGASISNNGQRVKILFTVLPENKEREAASFIMRRKKDFAAFVDKRGRIGRMPQIEFSLDLGEKNRQRIEFLSKNE
jgi:ribosome-binding factor A